MATILIVDDRPTNRDFLVTLLGYGGHRLVEAADGAEALGVAEAERPDLIISDILMPTMDGYEFVRQLRTYPHLAATPVIFSTAHYLDHEARLLAQQCGVSFLLPKPCAPEIVLATVEAALGVKPLPPKPTQDEAFDREHLKLLTDQLARKAEELQGTNQKLAALLELGQHLVSERDPAHLLEIYCRGARDIIGAKWAAVSMLGEAERSAAQLFFSGLDHDTIAAMGAVATDRGVLHTILTERRACRLHSGAVTPSAAGLPAEFPPVVSFLGVPIVFQTQVYGWLGLVDKLGSDAFSEVDEHLAGTLVAQLAVAHENARLFRSLQRQTNTLAQEVAVRRRAEVQVQSLNIALEQRVRERTAELEAANKELEAFSYSVAHDLRAPLRSLDGFAALLLEEYADQLDADGHHYLRRVHTASQHMAQLIDDLLELSRLTRHQMRREAVDLSALAQAIAAELQHQHVQREARFQIAADLTARGDARLLRVAFENLLGNSWKFTGRRQCAIISFGITETAGTTAFFIRDNGAGFNMAYADKLFQPFSRLHRQDEFTGTGIGLAIAQRIIHRHGGQIWAEGIENEGATVYFTLPET
jgi:signal transduction histidine kinase/DNA-binding response OmpR family regulator